MSNLAPEQRRDRNGNIVTRWVNMFKRDNRGTVSIPSPVIQPQEAPDTNTALRVEARDVLHREDGHRIDLSYTNTHFVIDHEPNLMRQVLAACWADKDHKEFWSRRFSNQYVAPQELSRGETCSEARIEESLGRIRKTLVTTNEASRLLNDIDLNARYSAMYYLDAAATRLASTDYSEQRLRACTLIAYAHGVHTGNIFPDNLKIPEDQNDYFVENLDRIRLFIPQVLARKTTDVEFVRELIEDTSPALAEGAL